MHIGQMKQSKYIKKEDIKPNGNLVTIKSLRLENVAPQDQERDEKWTIFFREFDKGMVLNWSNIQLIAKATGSEDTDSWPGKQVVLYVDDNVSFGGKLVGGIRVRAVRKQSAAPTPPPELEPSGPEFDDEIPF